MSYSLTLGVLEGIGFDHSIAATFLG